VNTVVANILNKQLQTAGSLIYLTGRYFWDKIFEYLGDK
jgi:hypothetical protein